MVHLAKRLPGVVGARIALPLNAQLYFAMTAVSTLSMLDNALDFVELLGR